MMRLEFVFQNFSDGFTHSRKWEADATKNLSWSWLLLLQVSLLEVYKHDAAADDDDPEKRLEAISLKPNVCLEHALLSSSLVLLSAP